MNEKKLFCVFIFILSIFPVKSFSWENNVHYSVSFPTPEKGWAVGAYGNIKHTEDSGKTWRRQKSPTEFFLTSVQFIDTKKGWACGYKAIIYTEDGGENWINLKVPYKYYFKSLYFIDDKKGWVVGEFSTILHTEDGGKTWKIQRTGQDFALHAVSFSDRFHGWAVGEFGVIYSTKDGGTSWELQRTPGERDDVLSGFGITGKTLWQIKAITKNEALACGVEATVIHTEDGGKTWRELFFPGPKTSLYAISFWKEKIIVGGKGILAISDDGGKTWAKLNLNLMFKYGWAYNISPGSECLYMATSTNIYKSRDGKNWERID